MGLHELLGKTSVELLALLPTTDSETQARIRFLLNGIKEQDHKKLVAYLEHNGETNTLREHFNDYKKQDVNTLAMMLKKSARNLALSALIAGLFIIRSVAAGEPLSLTFEVEHPARVLIAEDHDHNHDDEAWLLGQIDDLKDELIIMSVSDWAEEKRYLPEQVTSMPGFYDYKVAPYLREIADCMSVNSPVREIDVMKAAQIGATVGILENAIGYLIDHVKSAPCMLLTADAELAKLRVESYITPMLQHSNLGHLIRSADETNSRKTGKTDKKLEWAGGGFLVPFGAQNADKLRSISIRYLLEDECDSYPERVGKDGDPQKLAEARTKAYHESRKIARVSTPLIEGKSRIQRGYKAGDRRKYYVPCKHCGKMQDLVFQGMHKETGEAFGLVWATTDKGLLVHSSVRYLCKHCGGEHINSDKARMLVQGEWRATAIAKSPVHRSYHINALYSPVGMFPWEAVVEAWLEAWDVETGTAKNVGALQEFYNNNLGLPFKVLGSKLRFESVSSHRRPEYRMGQIPNKFATVHAGSHALMVVCQVDVHKTFLAVSTKAVCRDSRMFVVEYRRFEDEDCAELTSPVWQQLREFIEDTRYTADDGRVYPIASTFVDAGWAHDTVLTFCSEYDSGVAPILGNTRTGKAQTIKEFAPFTTQQGTTGYRIDVNHYKDRLAPVLRREWTAAAGMQGVYHFNAPIDISDRSLKELTVEYRREETDAYGGTTHKWYRPGNARNELWDLLVYAHANVEIMAWNICIKTFELQTIDWPKFWDYIEDQQMFFTLPES